MHVRVCRRIFVCMCMSTAHLRPPKCCVKQKSRENVETRSRQGFQLLARGGGTAGKDPSSCDVCQDAKDVHTHTHGECKGIYYFYDICVQSLDLFGLTNQNYFIRRRRRRLSAILFVGVAFAASFWPVPFALNFIQLSDLFVSQNKKELWLDEVVHEAYKGRFLSLDSRFSFPDLVKKTLLHGGWKWL